MNMHREKAHGERCLLALEVELEGGLWTRGSKGVGKMRTFRACSAF